MATADTKSSDDAVDTAHMAMVALVLLTATAVGALTYRKVETAILPSEVDRVEAHTACLRASSRPRPQRARRCGLAALFRRPGRDIRRTRPAATIRSMA